MAATTIADMLMSGQTENYIILSELVKYVQPNEILDSFQEIRKRCCSEYRKHVDASSSYSSLWRKSFELYINTIERGNRFQLYYRDPNEPGYFCYILLSNYINNTVELCLSNDHIVITILNRTANRELVKKFFYNTSNRQTLAIFKKFFIIALKRTSHV